MRNFTKILMAVVAMVALSCTTDTTQDLGVDLGNNGGLTEITLSLEASRTQLGEKAGDLYPLQWSEGDKISINGVESNALSTDEAGKATATFSVAGTLAKPYCIAYPAAPAGQVLFADKQTHTSNSTFASGVATMYAYAEDGFGVSLNHLTGVLKIGVVGSAKIVLAQISNANRKPIAGAFDFDFEKGEATATASSKELIEYSFGEGVQLSSEEPTYIHAVVPAGEYDELYVTLYDEDGGVMYATVKTDETKPLVAGKIREFSNNINYAPNASVFVVRDVASLKAFAEQAATLEKDVLFVADVDMTGEAWTAIDGYAGTIRGNGYAIKGLTAPLFNETNASIKSLHLRDVAITSNDAIYMGAFANKITSNDNTNVTIEHCSASGVLTVKNPTYASATKNNKTTLFYAGLIGYGLGVEINDCVNKVKLNVEQSAATSTTVAEVGCYGGIVGYITYYVNSADSSLITYSTVKNCTNQGAISIDEKVWGEGKGMISHFVGGIVAFNSKNNVIGGEISNCVNDAPISLNNPANYGASGEYTMVGGVVGYAQVLNKQMFKISDCVNTKNGKMTISGKGTSVYVGGIGGYVYNCDWKNITNYADIECPAILSGHFYIAGCLSSPGLNDSGDDAGKHIYKGDNINNYGKVKVTGAGGTFYVGGLLARASQGEVSNSNNYGEVYVKPTDATSITNVIIGGFEAVGVGDGDAGSLTNCHNHAPVYIEINDAAKIGQFLAAGFSAYSHRSWDNCSNEKGASLTIKGSMNLTKNNVLEDETTDSHYAIGSMCGYKATKAIDNSSNYADVNIDVKWTSGANAEGVAITPFVQIGGFFGRTHQNIPDNCRNYGTLTVGGSSNESAINMAIGGLSGSNIYTCTNWNNDCDVYISGSYHNLYAGGCVGYSHGYKGAPMNNAVNNGKLYVGVDESGNAVGTTFTLGPKIGGIIGYTLSAMTDCTNEGEIRYNANRAASASGTLHVGGIVGYAQAEGSKACSTTLTRVTNNGKITIEGNNGACEVWAGGVNGYMYGKGTQTGLVNNGDFNLNMDNGCTGHFKIGGVSGGIRNVLSDSENNGKITVTGTVGKTLYLGGIVANANGYNRTNLSSNGDIYVDANVKYDLFIGGMAYDAANGNISYTNCHNTANITVSDKTYVKSSVAIGGMIGKFTTASERKTFVGCSNSGNITCGCKSENAQHLGGLMGYTSNGIVIVKDGFTNSGNITHRGSTNGADAINVGGLFGYITATQLSYDTTTTTGEGDEAVTTTTTTSWTGNIINKGTITGAGKSEGGKCRFGGIVGLCQQSLVGTAKYINTGNIVFSGTAGSKNGVAGTGWIGGIVGVLENATIDNAEVHCSIQYGESKDYGFITGVARSTTVLATNCKIGGVTLGEWDDEDQVYKETKINSSNYYNFIYGSGKNTDWTGTDNYDGCSYISVAPTL